MDWRTYYKERLMSADEAVKLIKDNDKLVLAHDVGEPPALVEAMVRNAANYKNVEISHMFTLGSGAYSHPEYAGQLPHESVVCQRTGQKVHPRRTR